MQKFQMNDKIYVQESSACLLEHSVHDIIIIAIVVIFIIIIICLRSLQNLSSLNNYSVIVEIDRKGDN